MQGPDPHRAKPRYTARLSTLLGVGLGGLMALAVASMLYIGLSGARSNTFELLRDKTSLILDSLEQRVRDLLDPVQAQADYIRELIETGALDAGDDQLLGQALRASLAAAPQMSGVAFVRPDLKVVRSTRVERNLIVEDWSDRPDIRGAFDAAREGRSIGWRPPIWSDIWNRTLIVAIVPVHRDGQLLGMLVPGVLISDLSAHVTHLSRPGQMAFILYGKDAVLAHASLGESDRAGSLISPVTPLAEIDDPVLRAIWSKERFELPEISAGGNHSHAVDFADDYYVYIYREIRAYGETPWLIGAALPGSLAGGEVARLRTVALAGLGLLVFSILAAVLAGRRIARPVNALVALATSVRTLDLSQAPRLPRSRVRELDVAADALNAMVAALRWFELYLPRSLVRRILQTGEAIGTQPEARDVTVMFTDIEGFSGRAAALDPYQTAAFLNEHFGLIGGCVEEEAGTVDKYIGDAVMAFWGAPESQEDHAARACRSALAIAAALEAHNEVLARSGVAPVVVRIGISTGRVLVGNIGAPGRVNFTLVGDVVNVAERLEQLGKDVEWRREGDAPSTQILISAATRAAIGDAFAVEDLGERVLRGRAGRSGVFRLRTPAPRPAFLQTAPASARD